MEEFMNTVAEMLVEILECCVDAEEEAVDDILALLSESCED